jgi:hypothetical protein
MVAQPAGTPIHLRTPRGSGRGTKTIGLQVLVDQLCQQQSTLDGLGVRFGARATPLAANSPIIQQVPNQQLRIRSHPNQNRSEPSRPEKNTPEQSTAVLSQPPACPDLGRQPSQEPWTLCHCPPCPSSQP